MNWDQCGGRHVDRRNTGSSSYAGAPEGGFGHDFALWPPCPHFEQVRDFFGPAGAAPSQPSWANLLWIVSRSSKRSAIACVRNSSAWSIIWLI